MKDMLSYNRLSSSKNIFAIWLAEKNTFMAVLNSALKAEAFFQRAIIKVVGMKISTPSRHLLVQFNKENTRTMFFCCFFCVCVSRKKLAICHSFFSSLSPSCQCFWTDRQKFFYKRLLIRYPESVWPRSNIFHWTHQKRFAWQMFFKILFAMRVIHARHVLFFIHGNQHSQHV